MSSKLKSLSKQAVEYSLVIPAYNASHTLEKCVQEVRKVARRLRMSYSILIAEDGSSDGTEKIAARLATQSNDVIHLHNDRRLGRGLALKKAFAQSRSPYVIYIDADLDITPSYLKHFVDGFKQGFDVITVSKRHPLSQVRSPLSRKILSQSYHILVRKILKSKIFDHQGGMKGLNRVAIERILPLVEDNRWFWDTELLVIGQWAGLKILEVPIKADYAMHRSTVRPKDVIEMLHSIIKLKRKEKKIKAQLAKHLS